MKIYTKLVGHAMFDVDLADFSNVDEIEDEIQQQVSLKLPKGMIIHSWLPAEERQSVSAELRKINS